MKKRHFLAALAGGSALPAIASAQGAKATQGPALLTVTGAIAKTNRGPFDPVLDVMMVKQKLTFDKARTFGFAELAAMPAVTIKPTLEYDSKRHELKGPLLTTVLQACGATGGKLAMRAVDGYAPTLTVADARKYGYIVATHLDGRPMPLGGLGPLWAVFEPDRFPEAAAKPVDQRFAGCPWALFHIDVQA
jgi:hypothetical protein